MFANIISPAVTEALGHSLVYEEYRGDFAHARRLAEEQLSAARRGSDPVCLADALLACGVVYWLQGEPSGAAACFAEVERAVPDDANRLLLAFCYTVLNTHLRHLIFPHGGASATLETGSRWDQMATGRANEARWQELIARADDPAARLHAALLYRVLHNVPIGRYVLDGSRDIGGQEETARRAQMFLQPLQQFRQQAEASGVAPGSLACIDRLLADLCHRARYLDQAQQFLKQAHEIFEREGDLAGVACCWTMFGDWMCAPVSSPLIWNHLMIEGAWENSLSRPRERAEFDRSSLKVETAAQAYAEAEKAFRAAQAARGQGAVALRRGFLRMLSGEYEEAVEQAELAQQHFESTGDGLGVLLARVHRAAALVGTGRRSEDHETATLIGEWGSAQGSFSYASGLGLFFVREGRRWLTREGDYERAMSCYRLACSLFQALGAEDNAAQALGDQGIAHSLIGDRAAARVAYEQAREAFSRISEKRPTLAQAAWQKAVLTADEVCQIALSQQDAAELELSAARLQELYARPATGGPELFGEEFPDTLSEQVSLRGEIAQVFAPLFRALDARQEGRPQEAEALFGQSLRVAQQVSPAQRDFLSAAVLRVWPRPDEARQAFDRYLAQGGAASGFIDDLSKRLAQRFGAAGQAIADQRPEQTARFAARFFADVKDYGKAQEHLATLRALGGAEWWAEDQRPWEELRLCGEVAEGLGYFEEAFGYYDRAIELLEARWQLLTRDETKVSLAGASGSQWLYFCAARATAKAWRQARQSERDPSEREAERLFAYAERGKARSLLDLMANAQRDAAGPDDPTVRDWHGLNAQLTLRRGLLARERSQQTPDAAALAALTHQIAEDEAQLRRIEGVWAQAVAGSPPHALGQQARTMLLGEVRAALPPQTTLLQYFFLGDDLLAWAIKRDEPTQVHHAAVEARGLARQVREFHRACERGAPWESHAAPLAEQLLEPFAEVIRASDQLIIVPYGAAHLLPFQALPFDRQPLAAQRAISYLPSASALQFWRAGKSRTLPDRVLAVGNPSRDLRAAATEAAFVASLFGQQPLLGEQATQQAVIERIAGCPLLHFATHGRLFEGVPLNSSLALANGEELTVSEFMGLRLQAALVVLSACNTGRGETTGGDDVLGLTRGLLAAGARAAVVSLWSVNDVSTSLLMGHFYRRLQAGEAAHVALQAAQNYLRGLSQEEIARALAELNAALEQTGADPSALDPIRADRAQRDLRPVGVAPRSADYRHPFYWAPFILVGDVGRVM